MAMQVILIMKQEEGEVLDRSSSSLTDASWTNESCALRKQNACVVPCARIDACILIEEDLIILSDYKRRVASAAHWPVRC
jgi:hypothetical protein